MGTLKAPPTLQQAQKYLSYLPNVTDVVYDPLYDRQTYATTGFTQQLFFQVPAGQNNRTKSDTNMTLAGQLPAGVNFMVTSIEVAYWPAAADIAAAQAATTVDADRFLREMYSVYTSLSHLIFHVGSLEKIIQGPLIKFPPSNFIDASVGISTTVNNSVAGASFAQLKGKSYETTPIFLTSSENFDVTINYTTAVAVTNTAAMQVTLNGFKYRNAR